MKKQHSYKRPRGIKKVSKAQAKLDARIKDYEASVKSQTKTLHHKPGSMNIRKQA